MKACNITQATC